MTLDAFTVFVLYFSTNLIPLVSIDYKVTNVFPTSGSQFGGTKLTVTGAGFGTDTEMIEVRL